MMKSRRLPLSANRMAVAMTAGLCFFSPFASAAVVTFDGLSGATGDTFITYHEGDFIVESQFGAWTEHHAVGNAAPSIQVSDFGGPTFASLNVTASGDVPFVFESIDFHAFNAGIDFKIGGSLNGASVFSFDASQAASPGFMTVLSASSQLVDHVRIDISTDGPGSFNVDNIGVQAIPEPETCALMLAGLGLVGWAAGHRKRK